MPVRTECDSSPKTVALGRNKDIDESARRTVKTQHLAYTIGWVRPLLLRVANVKLSVRAEGESQRDS